MKNLKNPSPLVDSVLKLDHHLSEIERLGERIETSALKSEFDFEQLEKLMASFTLNGQGVADEILQFSNLLNTAREKAEAAATMVAAKAQILQARHDKHQEQLKDFQNLGQKVKNLTQTLGDFRRPDDAPPMTAEERSTISKRLADFQTQIAPLVKEAEDIRLEAREARLKSLEQDAESLMQQLIAASRKLDMVNSTLSPNH